MKKKKLTKEEMKALLLNSMVEDQEMMAPAPAEPKPLPPDIENSLLEDTQRLDAMRDLSVRKAFSNILSGIRDLGEMTLTKLFRLPPLQSPMTPQRLLKISAFLVGMMLIILICGLPLYGTYYLLNQINVLRSPTSYPGEQPALMKLEQSKVSVFNNTGRKLYSYELTPGQQRYPYYNEADLNHHYLITPLDLARSWEKSLLFVLNDTDAGKEGADLLIFSQGEMSPEMVNIGEYLEFPENPEDHGNRYHIRKMFAEDLNRDGYVEMILTTWHRFRYSSQIYVLDHTGKALMRYTNAGTMFQTNTFDIDGDGIKEVIGSGTDNYPDLGCAMVVGFSPFSQTEFPYGSLGKPRIYQRGKELERVAFCLGFKPTRLSEQSAPRNIVGLVEHILSANTLLVSVCEVEFGQPDLLYTLSLPELKVVRVETGDTFDKKMKALFPEITIDERFKEELRANVIIWDHTAGKFVPAEIAD